MQITKYVSPLLDQNMYIITEKNHCIVIDPYYDDNVIHSIDNNTVDFMLVTHEHYDHISGVNQFKKLYGCKLISNEKCNKNMQKPSKNFAKYFEAYCKVQKGIKLDSIVFDETYACVADELFDGEELLQWQGHSVFIKEAPGHSAGGNFIFLDKDILFSGDVLLPSDIPADRFPGGDKAAFAEITVPYLKGLSQNIMVYPGHNECFLLKNHALMQK